jgi:hypothetical protein
MLVINKEPGQLEALRNMKLPDSQFFALEQDGKVEKSYSGEIYVSKNPAFRYSPTRGKTIIVHIDEGDGIKLLQRG